MESFGDVQRRLGDALAVNERGRGIDHVVVVLPSYSVGESLLSHYAERIPALEHRFLVAGLLLHQLEGCHMVFVTSQAPVAEIVEYYASLGPYPDRVRARLTVLEVPDRSARAVAPKLLERPDLLAQLRNAVGGRPVLIEPWNVTNAEVAVACHISAPVNGTAPDLRALGCKSEGRRLLKQAGVTVPFGVEDVASVGDVLDGIAAIRNARPAATRVVVKLDDSGAGDGNVVLDLRDPALGERLRSLPEWYIEDLASGGIVEEYVLGTRVTSPSAQIDVRPNGEVRVLATHEQVLGGADGQVYMGCRFPADAVYAADLARRAEAVGEVIASRGVLGRVSVDFAAAQDSTGRWELFGLEMNIRKGGTSHPYTTLRSLVPGGYDAESGQWIAADGTRRTYSSTDNLVDPGWTGLDPAAAIGAVAAAGLQFDARRGTGVVLHMLSGLAIDGRLGLTAIGRTAAEAASLHEATARAIADAATSRS